jgi:hypothetical protein
MPSSENKAVFLSYASQDAEAARRLCEVLRGAGVDVWFDQSELVGGDAWDAKIRKQIRDCALFVPVISAATQARREAYFRLEWKLAAQRTHMMAAGTPFVLPVVMDATGDADALVPDEFREVQWTRLPGGESAVAFAERVKRLCGGGVEATARPRAARPFIFRGRNYSSPAQLATGLMQDWPEAVRRWSDGSILEWAGENIAEEKPDRTLRVIAQSANLDPDQSLAVALLALNPDLPLIWRGEVVTDAWMAAHPELAGALCASAVPEWLEKLRGDDWLRRRAVRRKAILGEMPATALAVDHALVERFVFGPVAAVEKEVQELTGRIAGAADPVLERLLGQEELSLGEAILLLAVPRGSYVEAGAASPAAAPESGAAARAGGTVAAGGQFAELRNLEGHTGPVNGVTFSAGVRWLVSGGADAKIIAWNPRTGEAERPMAGVAAAVGCVAFGPDGRSLVSGGADGFIRLWEVNVGRELRRFAGHKGIVSAAAFSPDGRQLASGGSDHCVRLWNFWSGEELGRMTGHADWISGVAFSPDGRSVASSSADGSVRLWDAGTGRELRRLGGHAGTVHGVAFSHDGKCVASAGADHTVRLWAAKDGAELRQFPGHAVPVYAVAFSHNGRWLASGGRDQIVRLWDLVAGGEPQRLEAHTNAVRCLAFSLDGSWLASGSADHSVRVWKLIGDEAPRAAGGFTPGETAW